MTRKLFGTDGIRGVANEQLTPELVFSIAQAAGVWLQNSGETPAAVVGMDTRRSGPMLESAVAAGLWTDVSSWCGDESHHDDMTLLVLRVTQAAQHG